MRYQSQEGQPVTSKIRSSATEALAGNISDGMVLAVGGFGLSEIPRNRIDGGLVLGQVASRHSVAELQKLTGAPFDVVPGIDGSRDAETSYQVLGAEA